MSIFSRMGDIVNANLNAMLDRAEDPEKVIRLVIQEMEDTLVEVRSAAARLIAERKRLERRLAETRHEVEDWSGKAELAVTHDREDLAIAALEEKRQADHDLAVLDKENTAISEELGALDEDIGCLQVKLDEAKTRQKTLLLRQRTASQRLRARQSIHDGRLDRALDRFEHYEQRVQQLQAKVESYDLGRNPDLRSRFHDLEMSTEVASELEHLRRKLGKATADDRPTEA